MSTEPGAPAGQSRTVLVTGASSGIGRATAHLLATQRARLVLVARAEGPLEQARQECVGRGAAEVVVLPADVSDAAAVDAVFEEALARLGHLDAVVQSAGVAAYGRFEDIPPEVFDGTIATNVTGVANVSRAALRAFGDRGGSLVVVGSVLGKIATPYMSPYATSKWAIQGLVRTLQIEARQRPEVQISLVTPGGVDTPIYDQAASYTGHPGSPPPPVISPERVATTIVRALDRPGRDLPAGAVNWLMVTGFRLLPGVYDALVGPLMRTLGQGRASLEPTPGNVNEPIPDREAVRGRWPHIWG